MLFIRVKPLPFGSQYSGGFWTLRSTRWVEYVFFATILFYRTQISFIFILKGDIVIKKHNKRGYTIRYLTFSRARFAGPYY